MLIAAAGQFVAVERAAADDAFWQLRDSASGGEPGRAFAYGPPWAVPLGCDFNGGGSGVALFDSGVWHIRYKPSGGLTELSFSYGWSGTIPICGDWNGDGWDGIGVYDGGRWFLRDTASPGAPERILDYGWQGATPVIGDWDADGTDGIGVFSAGRWMLRDTATAGSAEYFFDYGWGGTIPVTGDWNADGADGVGVVTDGRWLLRETASHGGVDRAFDYGWAATKPVTGDWAGVGGDGIGAVLTSSPIPPLATTRGVTVHVAIVAQVRALLTEAGTAGLRLGGQGYRSHAEQIEERRRNCGPTYEDIWVRPASQCNPPTARPGTSMHEQGLAIDFTWNGRPITTRDNAAFGWLAAHAHRFGLQNLPSEPWHWSTNGR
jgi:hypothetical protein